MPAFRATFVGCVLGALLASVVTKVAADALLQSVPYVFAPWGLTVGLRYALNPGMAFGLRLPSMVQTPVILCALAAIAVFALRTAQSRLSQAGFGFIIGGALGNVTDRLRDGFVTDFFQVGSFPIFNVADSCITIGVCLLLLETVLGKKSN